MGDVYLSSTSLPLPYLVLFSSTMPLVFAFIVIEIWRCTYEVKHGEMFAKIYRVTAAANVVMLFLAFVMLYVTRLAYSTMINPTLPSGLKVEEVDLNDVPEEVIERWAARIDKAQGTKHIGAWDGRAAFDMMRLYSKGTIKHTEGICLKITRKAVRAAKPIRTPLARMFSGNSKESSKHASTPPVSSAGDSDIVGFAFIFLMTRFDLAMRLKNSFGRLLSYLFGSDSCLPLLTMRWGLVGFQWPFHSGVFLADVNAVEHGNRSQTQPLSPIETAGSRKWDAPRPVDIMNRIMRSIIEWNDKRGSRGATVLMLPSMSTQLESQCYKDAGYMGVEIGPSCIVDIRRSAGKKFDHFLTYSLKKEERRAYKQYIKEFEKKCGGEVHCEEKWDAFSHRGPEVLYDAWLNIAKKRVAQGEVATLVEPKAPFFRDISTTLSGPFRRLFALSVPRSFADTLPPPDGESEGERAVRIVQGDREVVGTGVVFRFPRCGLLTSDIQGLHHHLSRKTRAYFVMMQRAVMLAQAEGFRWVDFGPTTEDPKIDVGARRVPCFSGYHTRSMLMKSMIKAGTEEFRRSQEERRAADGDTSHKDMKLDVDCFQWYSSGCYPADTPAYSAKSEAEIKKEAQEEHNRKVKEERKRAKKARKAAEKAAKKKKEGEGKA